jgi:hypothetical protein
VLLLLPVSFQDLAALTALAPAAIASSCGYVSFVHFFSYLKNLICGTAIVSTSW